MATKQNSTSKAILQIAAVVAFAAMALACASNSSLGDQVRGSGSNAERGIRANLELSDSIQAPSAADYDLAYAK